MGIKLPYYFVHCRPMMMHLVVLEPHVPHEEIEGDVLLYFVAVHRPFCQNFNC